MRRFLSFMILASMFNGLLLFAQEARLTKLKGSAQVLRFFKRIPAERDMVILPKDIIKTFDESALSVKLPDGSLAEIGANSRLKVAKYFKGSRDPEETELELFNGTSRYKVEKLKKKNKFVVKTPAAVVGVRGTEFIVKLKKTRRGRYVSSVMVKSGRVGVSSRKFANVGKPTVVNEMQATSVSESETPSEPVSVSPQEIQEVEAEAGIASTASDGSESDAQDGKKKDSAASLKRELRKSIQSAINQVINPTRPEAIKNSQVERIIQRVEEERRRPKRPLITRPDELPEGP